MGSVAEERCASVLIWVHVGWILEFDSRGFGMRCHVDVLVGEVGLGTDGVRPVQSLCTLDHNRLSSGNQLEWGQQTLSQ